MKLHDTSQKKVFKNDLLIIERKFSFKNGFWKTPNPKFCVEIYFMSKNINIFWEAIPICNFMARTRKNCLISERKFSFKNGLKTPNPKFCVEIYFMSKNINIFWEAIPICNFMARTRKNCLISERKFSFKNGLKTPNPKFW